MYKEQRYEAFSQQDVTGKLEKLVMCPEITKVSTSLACLSDYKLKQKICYKDHRQCPY